MDLETSWLRGAELFNQGLYWEAHHEWEWGWTGLPQPLKSHIQGMIQVCGTLFHLCRGKLSPARQLCRKSLNRLQKNQILTIDGIETFLSDLDQALENETFEVQEWLGRARRLKARFKDHGGKGF